MGEYCSATWFSKALITESGLDFSSLVNGWAFNQAKVDFARAAVKVDLILCDLQDSGSVECPELTRKSSHLSFQSLKSGASVSKSNMGGFVFNTTLLFLELLGPNWSS
jgi:hypothetical protein